MNAQPGGFLSHRTHDHSVSGERFRARCALDQFMNEISDKKAPSSEKVRCSSSPAQVLRGVRANPRTRNTGVQIICTFACLLTSVRAEKALTSPKPWKPRKNKANRAKSGIEPDDMVGPVGYEPTNIVGSSRFHFTLALSRLVDEFVGSRPTLAARPRTSFQFDVCLPGSR
jgi:hypothetical protein